MMKFVYLGNLRISEAKSMDYVFSTFAHLINKVIRTSWRLAHPGKGIRASTVLVRVGFDRRQQNQLMMKFVYLGNLRISEAKSMDYVFSTFAHLINKVIHTSWRLAHPGKGIRASTVFPQKFAIRVTQPPGKRLA